MLKNLLYSTIFLIVQIICSQNKNDYPNFIFILADDQGWNGTSVEMIENNNLSKSDFYITPNIEKIASKSVIFSNLVNSFSLLILIE